MIAIKYKIVLQEMYNTENIRKQNIKHSTQNIIT